MIELTFLKEFKTSQSKESKTSESNEGDISYYWHFSNKGFKFQPNNFLQNI